MSDTDQYQGWTNYQTWVMNLWIDNEEWTYRDSREVVGEAMRDWTPLEMLKGYYEDEDTAAKARIWEAGERLEEWAAQMAPELDGMAQDLFQSAWELVDWVEIAESIARELAEA